MGRISDLWGRRRVYIVCLVIFIAGSALVAAAPDAPADIAVRLARTLGNPRPDRSLMSLYALIFGRVVQAFGAGAMVPVSMALVGDLYPAGRRAIPLGIIGGVDTAGWVLGHLYGGIMVQVFPWPVLFWLNIPITIIALVLTILALRHHRESLVSGRFDWSGAILISLSLTALNLALNRGTDPSPGLTLQQLTQQGPFSVELLLAALTALAAFIFIESRVRSPLFNLSAFRDRNISAASLVNLLIGFCLASGLVSVPLYMNTVPTIRFDLDQEKAALLAGYLLSALTIPMALASVIGGRIVNRLGYRLTTAAGAAMGVVGFWLMSRWGVDESQPVIDLFRQGFQVNLLIDVGRMSVGLVLAGIGMGITISPIATAVINAVSESERGVASALVIIMRLVGMTISISAMTTYGLRRSLSLRIAGLEGVTLADVAKQEQVFLETTTQTIDEIALIAGGVCAAALLFSLLLQGRPSSDSTPN